MSIDSFRCVTEPCIGRSESCGAVCQGVRFKFLFHFYCRNCVIAFSFCSEDVLPSSIFTVLYCILHVNSLRDRTQNRYGCGRRRSLWLVQQMGEVGDKKSAAMKTTLSRAASQSQTPQYGCKCGFTILICADQLVLITWMRSCRWSSWAVSLYSSSSLLSGVDVIVIISYIN